MMTVKNLGKAGVVKNYFEKDNYYTKDEGVDKSLWMGKGAAKLGLLGQVNVDQFHALLQGTIGDTQLGRKKGDGYEHRSGWDCTFSAPKSVSIVGLAYQDIDVIKAHQNAVAYAVSFLEANASQYRKRVDSHILKHGADNLLIASFLHDTSRELDPQLHTHCVVLNAVSTSDGWRSLSSENLLKLQKKAGLLYQNELARNIKKLGYGIELKFGGTFEIEGVSSKLIGEFSQRRKQILKYIEINQLDYSADSAQKAALRTRAIKKDVDRQALYDGWRAITDAYPPLRNYPEEVTSDSLPGDSLEVVIKNPENLRKLVRKTVHHIAEKDMSFSIDTISEHILRSYTGQYSFKDIESEVSHLISTEHLIQSDPNPITNEERYTTKEGRRIEGDIIASIHRGFNQVKALTNNPRSIADNLKGTFRNQQQIDTIMAYAKSEDRFFALQGIAGSGKTVILNDIKELALKNNYELLALAPTHVAVQELENSLGIQARTLDFALFNRNFDMPRTSSNKRNVAGKIWVIDESSFPSAKNIRRVLRFAEQKNARILFVGDIKQLESIEAGQGFRLMQEAGIDKAVITENVRQQDMELKNAVKQIHNDNYYAALEQLKPNIHQVSDDQQRAQMIVDEWAKHDIDKRDGVLVLTPSNEERKKVNILMREKLMEERVLKNKDIIMDSFENRYLSQYELKHALSYYASDVVRFNRTYKGGGGREAVEKGEYFDVVAVNDKKNILSLRSCLDGRYININPNRQGGNKKGGLSVFKKNDIPLQVEDRIRWTDNNLKIKRNTVLTVKQISSGEIHCVTDKKKSITLDRRILSDQHFTYDYASTIYSSQGKTCEHVLALANTKHVNVVNQKSFYVSVSRAKQSAVLFTDDTSRLKRAMEKRTGENTYALTKHEVKNSSRKLRESLL